MIAMIDIPEVIRTFNAGRDAERLALKYRNMRANPFSFLRGTCHLFYERLPQAGALTAAPPAWLCGDLHLENFGSYKGDNRLAYFDQNDFDETALAPCTWDLLRLLTSILVATRSDGPESTKFGSPLAKACLDAYANALAEGKVRWIERDTADGLIRELLDAVSTRTRSAFLEMRTDIQRKQRHIRLDGHKALPVSRQQRERVFTFLEQFAGKQDNPEFFQPLDVARRIAGTGSLGVERYIILVRGKGSPDGNYLLDLKEALPSALTPHTEAPQPAWENQAERIITIQKQSQAIPMAFLNAVKIGEKSFILRSLQPSEDRVRLNLKPRAMPVNTLLIQDMARITAWAHLRSSGRRDAANADELMDFASHRKWQKSLLELSSACSEQTLHDWKEYCLAYDDGFFETTGKKS
jgi:uncharacterized protein (DUF2252 family)